MAKKRSKSRRKNQSGGRSKRPRQGSSGAPVSPSTDKVEAQRAPDYETPEVQEPGKGASGILGMREFMSRKEEGPDAGLLHKRRSCVELSVWLGAAGALLFYIFHKYGN